MANLQIAISVIFFSVLGAKGAGIPGMKTLNYGSDFYDFCVGKTSGNYDHPTTCSKFISCSGTRGFEMSCPGQLLYNREHGDFCDYPLSLRCSSIPQQMTDTQPPTYYDNIEPSTDAPKYGYDNEYNTIEEFDEIPIPTSPTYEFGYETIKASKESEDGNGALTDEPSYGYGTDDDATENLSYGTDNDNPIVQPSNGDDEPIYHPYSYDYDDSAL